MYFFILGSHPELSKAEIQSKLKQLELSAEIIAESAGFLILKFDQEIDAGFLVGQLAGTIKIGKIISNIQQINADELIKLVPAKEKMIFGISPYGLNLNIDKLGLAMKKILKQNGHKARFVTSKESPLSSVIVQKELINKGVELVIMKANDKMFVGETLCVQPFELFSRLDYGRPNRDLESGMLPLKLAQMMINLSEAELTDKLLDPFCGSGTILQQAIFLGYKNIVGTDASKKALDDSKENLGWFQNEFGLKPNVSLYEINVEKISDVVKHNSIDAIITEPWLGPPLKGSERPAEMQNIIKRLETRYFAALTSMEKVLKPLGILVIIVPEFIIRGTTYKTRIEEYFKNRFEHIGHWAYARDDQMVKRHIYRLRKNAFL